MAWVGEGVSKVEMRLETAGLKLAGLKMVQAQDSMGLMAQGSRGSWWGQDGRA